MFLSEDELADLTGYKQARKQIAMLRRQGVPFHVNAAGHPKVARAIIEGRTTPATSTPKTWSPSWVGNLAKI
jgi:hypothetical protein